MSAPIPPIVIKGNETGLQPLLRAIEMRRAFQQQEQEFQLKREQFELDKLQQQKTAELTDEQILASKQERRATELEIKELERSIEGRRIGTAAINEIASVAAAQELDFASDEFQQLLREKRAEITDPFAQGVVDEFVDNLRQEATDTSTIESQQAAIAEAAEREARQQATEQRQFGTDTADVAMETGMSLGESAALLGQDLPPGVDPNLRFGTPEARAALTARIKDENAKVLQANTFLAEMTPTAGLMKGLLNQGVRVSLAGELRRTVLQKGFFHAILNDFISPDQQRLLQAMSRYAAAWQYFSSGQQINEQEYVRLVASTTPSFKDSEETIQQKLAMIDVQLEAIRAIAAGQFSQAGDAALKGINSLLDAATNDDGTPAKGWDIEVVNELLAQKRRTTQWIAEIRANPNVSILGAPPVFDAEGQRANQGLVDATRTNWSEILRGIVNQDSTAFNPAQANPVRR